MPIIQQAMAQAKPQPNGMQPAQSAPPDDQGGEQASPEEQAAYEKFVLAAGKVLYSQGTHESIMKMLQQGDPAEAMAQAVTLIVTQLDKKSGGKVPDSIILPAAAEILGLVAELAEKAKLFTADDRLLARAAQIMVLHLAEQYGVNPKDAQALLQSVNPAELQQIVSQQSQLASQTMQARSGRK